MTIRKSITVQRKCNRLTKWRMRTTLILHQTKDITGNQKKIKNTNFNKAKIDNDNGLTVKGNKGVYISYIRYNYQETPKNQN